MDKRVVVGNGNYNFVFRLKKFYSFSEVIKRCQMLGIKYENIPEDIRDEYQSCLREWDEVEASKNQLTPDKRIPPDSGKE
jgi:hypothetical protein